MHLLTVHVSIIKMELFSIHSLKIGWPFFKILPQHCCLGGNKVSPCAPTQISGDFSGHTQITRLSVHIISGMMYALVISKQREEYGHT